MRLKAVVAYDGAAYGGWQSQPDGKAVQDVLAGAVSRIVGERVHVEGAGRTDAGVHAEGQCCHFDVPDGVLSDANAWVRALNGNVPLSLRVLSAVEVPADFHARFAALGKIYRYAICSAPVLMPLDVGRAWHVPGCPDEAALRAAAAVFVGTLNFAAFSANRGAPPQSTVRSLRRIDITRAKDTVSLEFEGDGFLYKMVRMLTAAILRGAQGREPLAALESRLREGFPQWTYVAPACGLTLVRVLYKTPSTTTG